MKISKTPPKRRMIGLYLQNELHEVLATILKKTRCESVSKFVRNAIFEKANELGIDVSGIENPSWGVRRDLASGDSEAIERQREIARKAATTRIVRRRAKLEKERKEKGLSE